MDLGAVTTQSPAEAQLPLYGQPSPPALAAIRSRPTACTRAKLTETERAYLRANNGLTAVSWVFGQGIAQKRGIPCRETIIRSDRWAPAPGSLHIKVEFHPNPRGDSTPALTLPCRPFPSLQLPLLPHHRHYLK